MSESNGVIRTKSKGRRKFAFGEDGAEFEVDVIKAYDEWIGIDGSFRNEKRLVPEEQLQAWKDAATAFAERLSGQTGLDGSTVLEFLALLQGEAIKLQDFFVVKYAEKPKSVDSLESRITFST